ncbi:unnamed protein product [Euphydryas editha]|uniref:Reverse transcriptase domain-containing protein n=1 Tax=Euphydryas editha TaxID=104508 RepID=A0AAU9V8J2_EUPED|nr:unnamed protein product [Euphydryas editha]
MKKARGRLAQPRPRVLSCSDTKSSTSDDEYQTPLSTAESDINDADSPVRRSKRRRVIRPPPASLEVQGQRAPTRNPAAGGAVRRMRWTQKMNESVMRAYYEATGGGINLTAYRSTMLSLFQALEPTVTVTAQRLSDQVRAIQRCHLLDESILERLRTNLPQFNTVSYTCAIQSSQNMQRQVTNLNVINSNSVDLSVNCQDNEHMRRALEDAILKYRTMPPNIRPHLPRLPIHRRNLALVGAMDKILKEYLGNTQNLSDTHSLLYCGAAAVCNVAHVNFPSNKTTLPSNTAPAWQVRIEKRIHLTRTLIAKLICFRNGNRRPKIMRFVHQAFAGTNITSSEYINSVTDRIDFLKQKLCAWAKRIKRYKKRRDRYYQNSIFQSDQRKVYRNWEQCTTNVVNNDLPDRDAITNFWRNIWSDPIDHIDSDWMSVVRRRCNSLPQMETTTISPDDVSRAIRSSSNWKCPGRDGLHNFWLKWFRSSHPVLATQFQDALITGSLPTFMTTGFTFLLYKSGSTTDPKNYRPITCLPTIYKLLTSILATKIMKHITTNNILATAQNGCKPGSRGTKELLLIDMTICQQVRRNRKNLAAAWIDYKKAYDSVPHSWLMETMKLYRIDTALCSFLGSCMEQWTTYLQYPGGINVPESTEPIRIKRGIFQGDSLSPLWFCLAMNPLSTLLEDSGLGFHLRKEGKAISHLFYMDDLKLFASKRPELYKLLKITETFSTCIKMEFGVDKCAFIHVERGRIISSENLQLTNSLSLRSLNEGETYKYLGMSEALGIDDGAMKQLIRERFFGRLKKVLNSFLSGGNKVRAFNSWVMPLIVYTFGILRWTQTELDSLDRKVRKMLTIYRMHHPRSSLMRLYIPRKCGGRGFLNAKDLHNRVVYNLREYFLNIKNDMHKDVVAVDKGFTPLSLGKEKLRKPIVMSTIDRVAIWRNKELHGRFYKALTDIDVDQSSSVSWLQHGNLFGETEGFVCAIMDEVIKTNNYRKHIMKDGTPDICRACRKPGESIRHIVSGCGRLANGEYLHRHNQVARIIHQQLALRYGLVENELPYYRYNPTPFLENSHALLYWDRSIITDRFIAANKPDIVLVDRSTRRAIIVDITIPHDDNLVKAEKEKLSKYLDLAHEITAMWNVDSTIIVPIVVSVNGLLAKSFDQHLKKLSLDCWIKGRIQKAVLLETARIVRRFLSLEP